jgi:predicted pyridoxine 5'-phosphate oxidase superfamily flavin-nucleotide-binding protein
MLTDELKAIISAYPLGFVASVNDDGTPNLSPKGTFVILDDRHLGFGHIRSPRTLANIGRRPAVEINFLDVLARKAARVRGTCEVLSRGTAAFDALYPRFESWGEYAEAMKALVRVAITRAELVLSPAYDLGHTEAELRAQYKEKFANG